MSTGCFRILTGHEVEMLLEDRTLDVIDVVRRAYLAHAAGESNLPNSMFVHIPGGDKQRVIALPGYLGGGFNAVGVKWIASFPGNIEIGLNRASAAIVLNSVQTGYPLALLEGSVISAKRTAASAALAAAHLSPTPAPTVGLIGCGLIAFEIVRFLRRVFPTISRIRLFDADVRRAECFRDRCRHTFGGPQPEVVTSACEALAGASVVSIATTAATPHLGDLSGCSPGAVVLHVSLRDLTVDAILASDNVVDDADHVCAANTSVHLTSLAVGGRGFIRSTLAGILDETAPPKRSREQVTVFSPFGLGVLDLAVARFVYDSATRHGLGTSIECFSPEPWDRARQAGVMSS